MKLLLLLLFVCSAQASLIDVPVTSGSSLQSKQVFTKDRIKSAASNSLAVLISSGMTGYTWMWKNPVGLTSQQAWDALGTDGAEAHLRYLAIQQMVNSVKPGTLPNEDCPIVINKDNTVTVNCQ